MLVDVTFRDSSHPSAALAMLISEMNGGYFVERVQKGVYIGGFNFNHLINEKIIDYRSDGEWPIRFRDTLLYREPMPATLGEWAKELNEYGVCDSPEQLLSYYDFEADPRRLVISFARLEKANEPPEGGWRWHKWGPYIGTQDPQCEHLADEPEIEVVYTYHVYQLADVSYI